MSPRDAATVVVVDSREQRPYAFPCSVIAGLRTGDYSVRGFEDRVAIERKSKADAYASLSHGRERFEREVARLGELDFGAIVVESTLPDFLVPPEHSAMHPRSALHSLLAWSVKYRVPVFFCGDRDHAGAACRLLLEKFVHYHGAEGVA